MAAKRHQFAHLEHTELCGYHYKQKGSNSFCKFGKQCHMAHSVRDLVPPPAGHKKGHAPIIFEGKAAANADQWVADLLQRGVLSKEQGFTDAMVRPPCNLSKTL